MNTVQKLRLLALNLALILACTLIAPIQAASAAETWINLLTGMQDMNGSGWSYTAADRTLKFDGSQYGIPSIRITGDLTVYNRGNIMTGQIAVGKGSLQLNNTGTIMVSGGLSVYDGALLIENSGKLNVLTTETHKDKQGRIIGNDAIEVDGVTVIRLLDGTMSVWGGDSRSGEGGSGIFTKSLLIAAVNANSDSDSVYEGKASDAKINIYGGNGGFYGGDAIVTNNMILDSDAEIIGGFGSSLAGRAVALTDPIWFGSSIASGDSKPISSYSAIHAALKSGSGHVVAAIGPFLTSFPTEGETLSKMEAYIDRKQSSPHIIYEAPSNVTPFSLEIYPKTYTITIDGNGGTINGQTSKTVRGEYPARVNLSDYKFTRPDNTLIGFEVNGQTVSTNYSFIPTEDTTVTAQWESSVSDDGNQIVLTVPASLRVAEGNSINANITARLNGNNLPFVCTSGDPDIATVTVENGKTTITGIKSGSTKITVTCGDGVSTSKVEKTIAVTVTSHAEEQLTPQVSAQDITVVYSGKAIPDASIKGTALYNGQTVSGSWAFKDGQALTDVRDSGMKTAVFTPDDSATYIPAETTIRVTIGKADPVGQPNYLRIIVGELKKRKR